MEKNSKKILKENLLEEDLQIALLVFNKNFYNYRHLEEDLLQEALIKLWKCKQCFNEKKSKYITFAYSVAYNSMLNFIKKENKYLNNVSLEKTLSSECSLLDLIPAEDFFDYDLYALRSAINTLLKSSKSLLYNLIVKSYLDNYSVSAFAEKYKISRQRASQLYSKYLTKFTEDLKENLKREF